MKFVLKCNNSINPTATDVADIWFSAAIDGAIPEKYIFSIDIGGKEIYKKEIFGGIFPVVRPNMIFKENAEYHYKAKAYLENGTSVESEGRFITAFNPKNAVWIAAEKGDEKVLKFVKHFRLDKTSEKYRLFACGLGYYDVYLNGLKVGDDFYKPLTTDYRERKNTGNPLIFKSEGYRICADVYDVSDFLRDGENRIEFVCGDGYYRNLDKEEEPYVSYGEKKIIFELREGLGEKAKTVVVSDENASVYKENACSSLFSGDFVDFSAEDKKAEKVVFAGHAESFSFPALGNDKIIKTLKPKSVRTSEKRKTYDFGINHSGTPVFTVVGEKGKKLVLKFAEVLNESGEPNYETSLWSDYNGKRKEKHVIEQKNEYVLSGGNDEIKPLFSWRCYRYLTAESDGEFEIKNIRSLFISGDADENLTFSCSEKIFEEIEQKSTLSLKDNLRSGLLTDCPHREKRAYTGDGQLVAESVLYLFDGVNQYAKWLDDILLSQRADGFIPYTSPCINGGGGYCWSLAVAVVPMELYKFTGDAFYIEKSFKAIERWINYLYPKIFLGEKDAACGWLLGDWLAPGITDFDVPFMGALCLFKACDIMAFFSRETGRKAKEIKYDKLKADVKEKINEKWLDKKRGVYAKGVQGENAIPLLYGIVPDECRKKVRQSLLETYENNGYKFDTGIVATPLLIDCLCENGMADVAYKLLTAKGYPSFEYMLSGETTLPEHWSKKWPDYKTGRGDEIVKGGRDLSHCHPMFASVVSRIIKYAAGLDLSELYKGKVIIAPKFAKIAKSFVKKETLFGEVSVKINRSYNETEIEIIVPAGLKAEIVLDGASDVFIDGKPFSVDENQNDPTESDAGKHIIKYITR